MRLNVTTRERVIALKSQGYTYRSIKERLHDEGITVSIKTLYLLVAKYKQTGTVDDRPRSKREKLLRDPHYCFIDIAISENDELTTRQLHSLLVERFPGLRISLSTVRRARADLGWVVTTPKYCQLIRDGNKEKRLAWCQKMVQDEERFDDVIFTDESSVMLEKHRKKCYRRKGDPRKLKPRPKHPVKVHVWGGISKRGATSVVIFTGIMTAVRYTKILEVGLVPFVRNNFPSGHRFQQDNDPKHCAKYTKRYMTANDINWWPTPAESPDLNPIENIWGTMKEFLRNEYKPRGLEELKSGIREFWGKLTPATCTKYIDHLHTVIPIVIQKQGGPSGY